ncbi:MAG: shikimate dehydrogenase [Clostridia bacterium]|nr:shikimate dehydrogenase [Clostridia bacterium]
MMKYGLIGEKLTHSFSKTIHEQLADDSYALIELTKEQLQSFFAQKDFLGVNVTIPYKQSVMPLLDEIDTAAANIGAVNTVVNRGGKLFGYNTDYLGLKALIEKNGVSLGGKKVIILGSGGTSLTAKQAATNMGAATVYRVSRAQKEDCITYAQLYAAHADAQVLMNTTPVGMYPHIEGTPADISKLPQLEAVFDAVYNPLRTDLVLAAKKRGLVASGGLYMLVAQAVYARQLFTGTNYDAAVFDTLYQKLLNEKTNIVLSGMPGSGKSTVGTLLAAQLARSFVDTDALIVKQAGMSISDIFTKYGEVHFRRLESEVIASLSGEQGLVIALGGGAVLKCENVQRLKRNGKIHFLNRRIEDIVPTADRPLATDRQALQKRFDERYEIYLSSADTEIQVSTDAAGVAASIGKDFSD